MREPDEWEARQEERLRAWLEAPGTRERLREQFGPIARRAAQVGQQLSKALAWYASDEFQEFWAVAKPVITTHKRGGGAEAVAKAVRALYAWADCRAWHGSDSTFRPYLTDTEIRQATRILNRYLEPDNFGHDTPSEVWQFVEGRRGSFVAKAREIAIDNRIRKVEQDRRRFESVEESLRLLARYRREEPSAILRDGLQEITSRARARNLSNEKLLRTFENDIRREYRRLKKKLPLAPPDDALISPAENSGKLRKKPKVEVPYAFADSEPSPLAHIGADEEDQIMLRLCAEEGERDWAELKRRAGLSRSEEIILELHLRNLNEKGAFDHEGVAKELGVAVGTVKSARSRYTAKLARVRRAS